eukprot:3870665-Pleurochrysis_carterae.AAC.2
MTAASARRVGSSGRREQRGAGAAAAGAQRRDEEAADGLVQLARAARRAAGPRHQVLRRVRSRRRRAGEGGGDAGCARSLAADGVDASGNVWAAVALAETQLTSRCWSLALLVPEASFTSFSVAATAILRSPSGVWWRERMGMHDTTRS